MADIEAIARRIFEAYKTRMVSAVETADAAKSWEEWYKHDWHRIPGRDTFRIMAGASLEPVKATLDVTQMEQVIGPDGPPTGLARREA